MLITVWLYWLYMFTLNLSFSLRFESGMDCLIFKFPPIAGKSLKTVLDCPRTHYPSLAFTGLGTFYLPYHIIAIHLPPILRFRGAVFLFINDKISLY